MDIQQVKVLVLVLVRVATMMAFLPFLGTGSTPKVIKALASLAIALVLYPFADVSQAVASLDGPLSYFLVMCSEVTFGALVGFCAMVVFQTLRHAGEMMGHQMGMGLARAADPVSGVEATVVANFCDALGVLTFFALGGHCWMIAAIDHSFAQWPVGVLVSPEFLKTLSVSAVRHCFAMSFQLAAPLVLMMFMIALLMAVTARLVPEINVLIVGFPLRVGVGLVGLMLFTPVIVRFAGDVSRLMIRFLTGCTAGV